MGRGGRGAASQGQWRPGGCTAGGPGWGWEAWITRPCTLKRLAAHPSGPSGLRQRSAAELSSQSCLPAALLAVQAPAGSNPGSVLSWAHVKDVLQLPDKAGCEGIKKHAQRLALLLEGSPSACRWQGLTVVTEGHSSTKLQSAPLVHRPVQVWERVAAPIRNMFVTFAFSGEHRAGWLAVRHCGVGCSRSSDAVAMRWLPGQGGLPPATVRPSAWEAEQRGCLLRSVPCADFNLEEKLQPDKGADEDDG